MQYTSALLENSHHSRVPRKNCGGEAPQTKFPGRAHEELEQVCSNSPVLILIRHRKSRFRHVLIEIQHPVPGGDYGGSIGRPQSCDDTQIFLIINGYHLLRNLGNGNHWLKIQFAGGGMGAKVWVTAGGETQFRELRDESSHFAHYNGPLHVGLGANIVVDDLRIKWPNGGTRVWTDVPVDQLLVVPPPRVFFLPLVFKH